MELQDLQRKRLYMRSIRRGIKEMDLILKAFADDTLGGMSQNDLDLYEKLLQENDHDLYSWVNKQSQCPSLYAHLISNIQQKAYSLTKF